MRRRVMTKAGAFYPLVAALLAPSSEARSTMIFLLTKVRHIMQPPWCIAAAWAPMHSFPPTLNHPACAPV